MADKIIVLENGKVSQIGTHEMLAGETGLYRRICEIQDLLEKEVEQVN
jgi:ABC-type multidrug transport system fused ATPase/permease subunit